MASENWFGDRAGPLGGTVLAETLCCWRHVPNTESLMQATAWWRLVRNQDLVSAQDTEWTSSSWLSLCQRVVAAAARNSACQSDDAATDGALWLTLERLEEERESVLTAKSIAVQAQAAHEENGATRLSAEEAGSSCKGHCST